jgi:hypothetical protein
VGKSKPHPSRFTPRKGTWNSWHTCGYTNTHNWLRFVNPWDCSPLILYVTFLPIYDFTEWNISHYLPCEFEFFNLRKSIIFNLLFSGSDVTSQYMAVYVWASVLVSSMDHWTSTIVQCVNTKSNSRKNQWLANAAGKEIKYWMCDRQETIAAFCFLQYLYLRRNI